MSNTPSAAGHEARGDEPVGDAVGEDPRAALVVVHVLGEEQRPLAGRSVAKRRHEVDDGDSLATTQGLEPEERPLRRVVSRPDANALAADRGLRGADLVRVRVDDQRERDARAAASEPTMPPT